MRYDQSGLIQGGDNVCHGESLTGTCDTKQSLKLVAFPEPFDQGFYGLRLVSGGLVFAVEFEEFLFDERFLFILHEKPPP